MDFQSLLPELLKGLLNFTWGNGVMIFAALVLIYLAVFTVLGYVVLTTGYSLVLKHVVILDVLAVAAGFVLRVIAGAEAPVGAAISRELQILRPDHAFHLLVLMLWT